MATRKRQPVEAPAIVLYPAHIEAWLGQGSGARATLSAAGAILPPAVSPYSPPPPAARRATAAAPDGVTMSAGAALAHRPSSRSIAARVRSTGIPMLVRAIPACQRGAGQCYSSQTLTPATVRLGEVATI